MDARRAQRTVIDPKVRQVGFITPGASSSDRSNSDTAVPNSSPSPISDLSPPGSNSLSPVMILPPRHASAPLSPLPRDSLPAGWTDSLAATSPRTRVASLDDSASVTKGTAASTVSGSLPAGDIKKTVPLRLSSASAEVFPSDEHEQKGKASKRSTAERADEMAADVQNNPLTRSKPLKEKTTKAERRAIQDAQRAAKAAAKASGAATANAKPNKSTSHPLQKSGSVSTSVPNKMGGGECVAVKDRRKDHSRAEKAKKCAVVKQTEARNSVEFFSHLPQYERGMQLNDLEAKYFQLDSMHPAVYKVGLQYLSGDICGDNAWCIAMLRAFQEVIKEYKVPPDKVLVRDLTSKISSYVSFLHKCRPLSISMGNAIKFLKSRIAKLPAAPTESEARTAIQTDIDNFIDMKIMHAGEAIVSNAAAKISQGDVLLTHGFSSTVEMIFAHASREGKQFRVVVVDSRPKLEGQQLVRKLVARGIACTYTHINAVSYIMHEVTTVLLGASSALSNGTVYSQVGAASVAMVAHAFRVPVLVCCESYKFHERVPLDSISLNELGDPKAISHVHGREEINFFPGCDDSQNLHLLNLIYDVTPSKYISMIITDCGMVAPTSVPVIVSECRKEFSWI